VDLLLQGAEGVDDLKADGDDADDLQPVGLYADGQHIH